MAVKTITIDMAAYELLRREKREGESFSKVIHRRLRPAGTARALGAALHGLSIGDETLAAMEEVVRSRKESPAASLPLE
jgi:predicted CopG family antitoxin